MGQKCSHCHQHSADSGKVLDIVVALHPHRAQTSNGLSFDRGNTLEVLNKDDKEWWLAKYPGHSCVGYIPASFVVVAPSHKSQEWYHGELTREETEKILMSRFNSVGAFLVRRSLRINCYVLSAKATTAERCTPKIKHYRILETNGYFMLGASSFLTLSEAVDYFVNGLRIGLPPLHPCVNPAPTMQDIFRKTKGQWEIQKQELGYVKKTDKHGLFGEVWLGNGPVDGGIQRNSNVPLDVKPTKEDKTKGYYLTDCKVLESLRHADTPPLYTEYYPLQEQEPLISSSTYSPCPKKPY